MPCRVCGTKGKTFKMSAKCSDMFSIHSTEGPYLEHNGYVPEWTKLGLGDYIEFEYCLSCGTIQDW